MTFSIDPGGLSDLSFAVLVTLCAGVAAIDLYAMIIPDILNFSIGAIGIGRALFLPPGDLVSSLFGGIAGGLLTGGVRLVHARLRGFEGLGRGDVKFAIAAGSWTGLYDFPFFLLAAALVGLCYVGIKTIVGRRIEATQRIPFGPFLVLSLVLVAGVHQFSGMSLADMFALAGS